MKISELKTGMWIEKRNGEVAIVLLGTNNGDIYSGQTWGTIDNEDLTSSYGKQYDITKVYQPRHNNGYLDGFPKIDENKLRLIWERKDNSEEIKRMEEEIALDEIALKSKKEILNNLKEEDDK